MKTNIRRGVCALAMIYAAQGVPAQEQTGNDVVIRHVRVFDGESMIDNTSVLIANGRVAAIGDPEEAQTWVDNRIAEGSEFIKIIYENGGDTGQGGRPSIDKATLQALVVAAHARGKLAVVHIHSESQAFDAIEANADGLAHLFSHGSDILDPRFAVVVAAHHAFVIPTLSVLASVCNQHPGRRVLNDAKLGPYILPS